MGTPDFAVPALQTLAPFLNIIEVITQPDRPVGRKRALTPPPVKINTEKLGLPVFQPEKIRDPETTEHIRAANPDLIIVAAYGQIIPKAILDAPRLGTLNIHASLLPKYRGASPIATAIKNGETETGVTIMLVDELLDHGPILAQGRIPIAPDETGNSLSHKLSLLGAQLLTATLPEWISGRIKPQEQNHTEATSTKLLTRKDGKINWHERAESIERTIRAYDPWPGTWTLWQHKDKKVRLTVLSSRVIALPSPSARDGGNGEGAGFVFKTPTGFAVTCGRDALEILTLQPEGKRSMTAADFLRGYPTVLHSIL